MIIPELKIEFDATQLLTNLAKLTDNQTTILQKSLNEIEAIVNQANYDQIVSEGARANTPYAPLTKFTQRMRDAAGYYPEGPILQASGQLLADMSKPIRSTISGSGQLVIEYQPDIPEKAVHQSGAPGIPERPMSELIQEDIEKIMAVIGRNLFDNFK